MCLRYLIAAQLLGWTGLVDNLTRTCNTLHITKNQVLEAIEYAKQNISKLLIALKENMTITKYAELSEDLTPVEKMRILNNGGYRNVKSMSDAKLDNNIKICIDNGFNHALNILQTEKAKRDANTASAGLSIPRLNTVNVIRGVKYLLENDIQVSLIMIH